MNQAIDQLRRISGIVDVTDRLEHIDAWCRRWLDTLGVSYSFDAELLTQRSVVNHLEAARETMTYQLAHALMKSPAVKWDLSDRSPYGDVMFKGTMLVVKGLNKDFEAVAKEAIPKPHIPLGDDE